MPVDERAGSTGRRGSFAPRCFAASPGRRAAAGARQARWDPAPVPVVHRLQANLARVHRVGRRPARRRRAADRVSPPELARRREPRPDALVPRVAWAHLRDRRRTEDGCEEPRSHRRRANEQDGVRPLPRPECGHLEQAHGQRRGALRLSLLGEGARGVGRAAEGARPRHRVGLRDVQQQRPLRDAVDRPRGDRARGDRRRPGEGRGGPGAGERADAPARAAGSRRSGVRCAGCYAPPTSSPLRRTRPPALAPRPPPSHRSPTSPHTPTPLVCSDVEVLADTSARVMSGVRPRRGRNGRGRSRRS